MGVDVHSSVCSSGPCTHAIDQVRGKSEEGVTSGVALVGVGRGKECPDAGCSEGKPIRTAPVKFSGGVASRERHCLLGRMKFLLWY